MKKSRLFSYALRSIRRDLGAAYMPALALAAFCVYFAGAIWADVRGEKSEPRELTVTAPAYMELSEQTVQNILLIPDVTAASGVLEVSVAVSCGGYTAELTLTGIDGACLDGAYTLGGPFPEESAMPWLVLTEAAAKSFADGEKAAELSSIDWLNTGFTLRAGEETVTAGVCGLIKGGEAAGYISRDMARALLRRQGLPEDYTAAAVRIKNSGAAEAVIKQLGALGLSAENTDAALWERWDAHLREAAYLLLLGAAIFFCAALLQKAEALRSRDEARAQADALRWMGMPEADMRALRHIRALCLNLPAAALGVLLARLTAWAVPPDMREITVFALTLPWPGTAAVFGLSAGAGILLLQPGKKRQ